MNESQLSNKQAPKLTPRMTMADYLTERVNALSHIKSLDEIAKDIGYERGKIITFFMKGEVNVPLDIVGPLARALETPLQPLFRLALEQFGPEMVEMLTEIFDQPLVAAQPAPPSSDLLVDLVADLDPAPPTDLVEEEPVGERGGPPRAHAIVDLNFKVSSEFHRQFRIEAATQGLTMKDLLILSFQAYLEQSRGPGERR